MDHWAMQGLCWLGVGYCSYLFMKTTSFCLKGFRSYITPIFWYDRDFSKKYRGKWAVVTGASEGIGRSYACALARRKLNVLIISRREEVLKNVAQAIRSLYGVEVRCLALNLSKIADEAVYQKLEKTLNSLDVAVLVNNVGTNSLPDLFKDTDNEENLKIISLNMKPVVAITHMILPQMIARCNGAIVNVSSISSTLPTPLYYSIYGSTKTFVDKFTKAVEYENRQHNITMQSVQPSFVSTNLTFHSPAGWFMVADVDVYVESAIRTLGVSTSTHGYWKHALFSTLMCLLPESLHTFFMYYIQPTILRSTNMSLGIDKKRDWTKKLT